MRMVLAGLLACSLAATPAVAGCLDRPPSAETMRALPDIPLARRAKLARGITLSTLFDPAPAGGASPDLAALFGHLRTAGLRHVRIPVSPEIFAPAAPAWQAQAIARLDSAVCAAAASDLGLIIDLHPFAALGPPGATVEAITQGLEGVWRQLAKRYGPPAPDTVFFEVLNEPKLPDAAQWEAVQLRLIRAIRDVAPANTVIATASPWSTAATLAALRPARDRNTAYAFHFYTPMIFTHQAASWSLPDYGSVRGLEFPARPGNLATVRRAAAPDLQASLVWYGQTFATPAGSGLPQVASAELDLVRDWARAQGAAVVVTEFGVHHPAPAHSRVAWLSAAREAFESRGLGWTVWEYRGGFGIEDDLRRGCQPVSVMRALGLCGTVRP